MARLCRAGDGQIDGIYRESHSLWGAGLDFQNYRDFWNDLTRTAWASNHVGFWVWLDDRDRVLCSMKLYHPLLRLEGVTDRITVIGAVFTPASYRGRGNAAAMIEAVLQTARESGQRAAMLFSDIGTNYYVRFGFAALPAEEHWGRLPRFAEQDHDGWTLDPARPDDFARIRQAHDDACRRRPLAMVRDEAHWEFLDVRSGRYFERLGDPSMRQHWRVARHEGRFAGYLMTVEGRGEWNVREIGAVGGEESTMARIIELGAAAARRQGLVNYYAWLPPRVAPSLPGWDLRTLPRKRAVPMLLRLDGPTNLGLLESVDRAYIPFQDQF